MNTHTQGPPKPPADAEMERHFNGIVMTVLAVIAVVLLLAAIYIKVGTKSPSSHATHTTQPAPQ